MRKPIGHLPVSTWRISEGNICCQCNSIIQKGFPYVEDDWYETCQNYCAPCAIRDNRNLVNDHEEVE